MRKLRWASWLGAMTAAVALGGIGSAMGDVTTDRAAAIVEYPFIVADVDGEGTSDTIIQLSNTANEPVLAHCFYINANAHCTNTGAVCQAAEECCGSAGCGICEPGWNETDFYVRLTPRQPLGWRVSEGLVDFPIDGVERVGSDGSSNVGSRIPPVPENPFVGVLKCVSIDDTGRPIDRNWLKGEATIVAAGPELVDAAKYNAVGIQAIEGAVNDDRTLVLGGGEAEYNGCPNVTILNHFFDLAEITDGDGNAVTGEDIVTVLALVPCSQDLLRQQPSSTVVQYLVYNEFEQRFSTSRTVDCQQARPLSTIDTTQPERSIFSVGVAGTIAGQSRLTPLQDGLLAVAWELHGDVTPLGDGGLEIGAASTAAFNVHYQGQRPESSEIVLP